MADNKDSDLFSLQSQLPEEVPEVPVIHTSSAKRQNLNTERFSQTLLAARQAFPISGEFQVHGDRAVLRNEDVSLEVFRASNSLWWTNHRLTNVDAPKGEIVLPKPEEALARAQKELEKRGLDLKNLATSSTSFTRSSTLRNGEPVETDTAIDVNFTFKLASNIPVFGPGAKIKVTFGHDAQLAQVVYFWRHPEETAESYQLFSPKVAVDRFQRDTAFLQLKGTDAKIALLNVQLGYYALRPAEMQRMYFPVYAIDAVAATQTLPKYEFRRYVVATDISNDDARGNRRAVANPAACRMF